jgi:hypothetical protein
MNVELQHDEIKASNLSNSGLVQQMLCAGKVGASACFGVNKDRTMCMVRQFLENQPVKILASL